MVVIRPRKHPTTFGILSKEVNLYTFGYKWYKQKKRHNVLSTLRLSLLRRQDSNMRPPGYEPGELPTAPLRDINHLRYSECCCDVIAELRVQRYGFFVKPPNVLATFLIKTLKKCIFAPFSWLFMSFAPILLTFA